MCALLVTLPLAAQVAGSLDPSFNPVVEVQQVLGTAVQPDGKILISGTFTSVNGEPRRLLARLLPDGTLEGTNTFHPRIEDGAAVNGVIVQPDGKILIGGTFTSVEGQARRNIARLEEDGSLESAVTFNPGTGPNDSVLGMALQSNGRILIGGHFTSVNGQARGRIAALNRNGTLESTTTFNVGTGVGGVGAVVRSIALWPVVDGQDDVYIVIGGFFTSVNGQPRSHLAQLTARGALVGNFRSAASVNGGGIETVMVLPNQRVLIGGSFTEVDGQPRARLAMLDWSGWLQETNDFNPGLEGGLNGVSSLGWQVDGKLLVAGDFATADGISRHGLARLRPDGTAEPTNVFAVRLGDEGSRVLSMAQQADGAVLLGGEFSVVNGQLRGGMARVVNDAAPQELIVQSPFNLLWERGGAGPELDQVTFEASYDGGASWSLLNPARREPRGWNCQALELMAGGWLRARGRTVGGLGNASSGLLEQIVPIEFIPRMVLEMPMGRRLTNGASLSMGAAGVGGSTSLGLHLRNLGNVLLTGIGVTIHGPDTEQFAVTAEPAAVVDPLGGSTRFTVTFVPTAVGVKTATLRVVSNDPVESPFDLLLTGRAQLAPVAGSVDPAFAPALENGYVQAAAVQPDGKLLIGGSIAGVDGEARLNLARLKADGSLESADTFIPLSGINGDIRWLLVQRDGKILIGGAFSSVNGQPRGSLARLEADGTLESEGTFNPGLGADNQIIAAAVQPDGKILIAGYFTAVNGEPRGGIARLHADGTLERLATFNPGLGANGGVLGLAVQPDGKIVLGGEFTSFDGQPRNGIVRLQADGILENTNTFNPGAGLGGENPAAFCVVVQPDGKILLGGYFTTVDGLPRHRIVRLLPDGSVEGTNTFNPGQAADDAVSSIAIQADGKLLLAGYFTAVNDLPRGGFARLLPDGAVEGTEAFNPGLGVEGYAAGVTLDAGGRIFVVGGFTGVDGQPRTGIARLVNDAAIRTLTVSNRVRLDWRRGGSGPELEQVRFELSTNNGSGWSEIGNGVRVLGGWTCAGLDLPVRGSVRVRGRTFGATFSGSSGVVADRTDFDFSPRATLANVLAELIALRAGVTNRVDARRLDVATKHLTRSLATNVWETETRLTRKLGHRAFGNARLTAQVLCRLIRSETSQLSKPALQAVIDRIFEIQRGLAELAIDEARTAGASSEAIARAERHLQRGDEKAAAGKCYRGVYDYGLAWHRARHAKLPSTR